MYDYDCRLTQATCGSLVNAFKYDYRSRRYYRATSTETNICVFDGGLSVQEYDGSQNLTPHVTRLTTEYLRGPDLGGGVGGMLYSIRDDEYGRDRITCSHSDHRGDVIARSDDCGSLTWFALYEAYGTRPYEWGTNTDRQMANTKDEEAEIGLLNEGMRFRDLETGTFLTRDPIRYGDGPNMYCYVHCNPITSFDSIGLLSIAIVDDKDKGSGGKKKGGERKAANGKHFKFIGEKKYDKCISASSIEDATAQVKELIDSGEIDEEITNVAFIDHGAPGVQYIGDSILSENEVFFSDPVATPLADFGSLLSDNATIDLMGCQVGQNEEYIQDLANGFDHTVTAGKGDTDVNVFFGLWITKFERTGGLTVKHPTSDDDQVQAESADKE